MRQKQAILAVVFFIPRQLSNGQNIMSYF